MFFPQVNSARRAVALPRPRGHPHGHLERARGCRRSGCGRRAAHGPVMWRRRPPTRLSPGLVHADLLGAFGHRHQHAVHDRRPADHHEDAHHSHCRRRNALSPGGRLAPPGRGAWPRGHPAGRPGAAASPDPGGIRTQPDAGRWQGGAHPRLSDFARSVRLGVHGVPLWYSQRQWGS